MQLTLLPLLLLPSALLSCYYYLYCCCLCCCCLFVAAVLLLPFCCCNSSHNTQLLTTLRYWQLQQSRWPLVCLSLVSQRLNVCEGPSKTQRMIRERPKKDEATGWTYLSVVLMNRREGRRGQKPYIPHKGRMK